MTALTRRYDRATWTPRLLAALDYAENGWAVVPLRPDSKIPALKDWPARATTDPATVLRWWQPKPRQGVGIVTGKASGLFVLDVDGEQGEQSLAALERQHGPLPKTLTALTPNGGRHLYFSHDGGKTTVRQLGPGLDTRADGGQVVAPPTAIGGRAYEWVDPEASPAAPPRWLLNETEDDQADAVAHTDTTEVHTDPRAYALAVLEEEVERVRGAERGTRNDALNRAAFALGRLVPNGYLAEADVVARLTAAALDAGLPSAATKATINSALTKAASQPRVLRQVGEPTLDASVAVELRKLRVKDEAARLWASERYAARPVVLPRQTLKDALVAGTRPEAPFRIRDLHRVGHNTTISAQYKTGKTTLGANLLRALADDAFFLDRFAVNAPVGRIGYVNYELTEAEMLNWLEAQGIESADRIAVLNLRGEPFTLVNDRHRDELVAWCQEMQVEVLHLDPHRRAFSGFGSENSNDDVNRFTESLDELKKAAAVHDLFLYVHMGRSIGEAGSERARGATALDDWADQRWVLTKDEQGERYLYADGRLPYVPEFRLNYSPETRRLSADDGDRRTAHVRRYRPALVNVLEVAGTDGMTVGELEDKLGVTKKGALATALTELVRDGEVVQRKQGTAKRTWLARFAPEAGP